MTPLYAQPSPELGLDLVRDAVDIRRLPRWDPRYWGHVEVEDEPRCTAQFRALGLSWAKTRAAKARAAARAEARTVPLAAERLPHEPNCERQLAEHELRREADHAIARESEGAVPAPIGAAPTGVIAAIDLDDEARRGGTEINDEGAEHDLALEADAELTGANGLPESLFGRRESRAQGVSAGREQLRASDSERAFFQGSLLVPAKWPGVAPLGAGSVPRARRIAHEVPARGTERAPLGAARPLRRDEVRDEQRSIHSPRVSPLEQSPAQQMAKSLQARPRLAGAAPQRDYLPHSRAARAGVPQLAVVHDVPRIGAGEHEFGEGRAPAGGVAAEDARVGAALVEASTYQGYGAKESDYRPERWKGFREDYGFTGKEDDAEFGIVYFGKRFYSPGLNRWLTADPLAVHAAGKADLNLYAYVKGHLLKAVDPLGLEEDYVQGRAILRHFASSLPGAVGGGTPSTPGLGGMLTSNSNLLVNVYSHRYPGSRVSGSYSPDTKTLYMDAPLWQAVRDTQPGALNDSAAVEGRRTLLHEGFHAYEDLVLKNSGAYRMLTEASEKNYYSKLAGGDAAKATNAREEAFAEYTARRGSYYATAYDELERLASQGRLTKGEYSRIRVSFNQTMADQAKTAVGYYYDDAHKQVYLDQAIDPSAKNFLDEMSGINSSFDANQGLARYRERTVPDKTEKPEQGK